MIGGKGSDYFDCGDGYDTIIDFEPQNGDTKAENCEITLTHNPNDIEFLCDSGSLTSITTSTTSTSLLSTSTNTLSNSTIPMYNNTIAGGSIINKSSDLSRVICDALEKNESVSLFSSSSLLTSNRKSFPTTYYEALTRN